MRLPTPEEAKKLRTGEGLIEFLTNAVQAERDACMGIAEAMAIRETNRAAEVALTIAAQIRART